MEQRERRHYSSQEDKREDFLEEEASHELDHEEETNAG